jgi:hypothetical protein
MLMSATACCPEGLPPQACGRLGAGSILRARSSVPETGTSPPR